MGETDVAHAGIDLDVLCLNDLLDRDDSSGAEAIRSDPGDHSIFVNSIFQKMKGREAFLSFSRQIADVNEILTMAYSSAEDIAQVILRDLALTSQVLRLVNSSFYRHFSQKGISTISEAMIILGTDEVRGLAASLKIYEMMTDLAHSKVLKDKTLKGLQRSIMAKQVAQDRGSSRCDALPVSAMIYDLGEYLVALFDPQRYIEIELLMETRGVSREEASKSILGLSYSDLGRVIAAKLNIPDAIVQAIRPIKGPKPGRRDLSPQEEGRYLCALVYELCEISVDRDSFAPADAVVNKYWHILGIDLRQAVSLMKMSRKKMLRHAELLQVAPVKESGEAGGIRDETGLKTGLNQIRDALEDRLSIHEIFTRIVEIMSRSFTFDYVVISIRNKQAGTMEPRFVKGEPARSDQSGSLAFKIDPLSKDLFNAAITRKTDMIVRDIGKEASKKKIPDWYLKKVARPARLRGFAVLPVLARNKLVAMIYVDWSGNAPAPGTLEYINVFRELMVKTFTLHAR